MDNIFKVTVIKLLKGKSNSAGSNYFLHWKVWICHYRCKRISGRISLYPRYKIILRAVIGWACHCHYLFILSTNEEIRICYVIYTGNRKGLLVWISSSKARESRIIHSNLANTIVQLVERTAFNQNKYFRNVVYIFQKMQHAMVGVHYNYNF